MPRSDLSLSALSGPSVYISHDVFIYLELANDEQNGGQSFVLRPRIAKLWQFKGRKVENNGEEDRIALFMAGLWRVYGNWLFLDTAKNGTIFNRN